jgi:hypothetical protein
MYNVGSGKHSPPEDNDGVVVLMSNQSATLDVAKYGPSSSTLREF